MANQRLQITFDGETFTLAKHFGGPNWRSSGGLDRLLDRLNAQAPGPRVMPPMTMHYEHDRVDWLDPPLSAQGETDDYCCTCKAAPGETCRGPGACPGRAGIE